MQYFPFVTCTLLCAKTCVVRLLLKYVVIYVNKRVMKVYCIEDIDHFILLSLLVVEVFWRRRGSLRSPRRRRKKSKLKERKEKKMLFLFLFGLLYVLQSVSLSEANNNNNNNKEGKKKPHIIHILADDLGMYMYMYISVENIIMLGSVVNMV